MTVAATALGAKILERREILFGTFPFGVGPFSLGRESKVGARGYQGSWDSRGQDAKEKRNVKMQGRCSECNFTDFILWHLPSPKLCVG